METDRINPFFGISKELNVQFCLGYDPMEFNDTLRAIAEGELAVAPLITGRGRPRRRRRRLRGPRQPGRPLQDPGDPVSDRFAGKVALVTGAARPRGIGRATALRLAADGADVACLDIARPYTEAPGAPTATQDDLDSVVAEIEGLGRRAVAVRADVSDEAEVEAAVLAATDALGTIELVANVAGGSGMGFGIGPLLSVGADEFRKVLDVNVVGTWLVSRACAQRMVDAKVGGRICNVSSQAGKKAFPMLGAYCAAKSGVILLTQCLATELGPAGISVNAVCPARSTPT